jgi:hypothetical protein
VILFDLSMHYNIYIYLYLKHKLYLAYYKCALIFEMAYLIEQMELAHYSFTAYSQSAIYFVRGGRVIGNLIGE